VHLRGHETNGTVPARKQAYRVLRSENDIMEVRTMKILAAILGAVTATALLSGCTYDRRYDLYGYGYGHDRYLDGYGYGRRYDRYGYGYGYGPRYGRYGYGYGYGYGYAPRYDRYSSGYGNYGESYWNARGCWLDVGGVPHCAR